MRCVPARDFTVVAGPNFERMESEVNGVRVQHWGLSGGEARWEETLGIATRALELFEARFGPYPYAELDSVAVPLRLASGVEYPGLILISQALYQPDNERPFYLDIVVSHEVAHQWWYATVGNDVLEYPWQDEALATFSA